jgi:hypothetical protein
LERVLAVDLDLMVDQGEPLGRLSIATLPATTAPIRDRTKDPERVASAPSIELTEASTYRYTLDVAGDVISFEPGELLDPDDPSLRSGRLRTGEAVGEVHFAVTCRTESGPVEGVTRAEVLPSKLTDEHAFREMLSNLSDLSVEVLHQGFAPSAGRFSTVAGPSPRLLYQQFALLHLRLFSAETEWALARVLAEPYRSWETESEERPLGAPIKGSSRLARSLTGGGQRLVAPAHAPLGTLPLRLSVDRTESTFDNVPNRYVRFVLERWRSIAADALDAVEGKLRGATLRRGRTQALRTLDRLDELLANPVLREAGILRSFPQGNQVLLKRDGYRQITAMAAVIESSLGLELEIEDPFIVSRRNIATLYEYWCFVRLAEAVGATCGHRLTHELFQVGDNGMSLTLKQGRASRLRFAPTIAGRELLVDLFFNREFGKGSSWTRKMRPDVSLLVRPAESPYVGEDVADCWLHFDAKYRVDWAEPFSGEPGLDDEELEQTGESKRTDLLKMHAYRDAIRDSAAAYVLFPGDIPREFRFAEETLPALGAFPLRPDLADRDAHRLEAFLADVFTHVANQATRHERARYWTRTAYAGGSAQTAPAPTLRLQRPPADTPVLFGYVRGPAHRDWIEEHCLYNVRGGDRVGGVNENASELDARVLILYSGPWHGPPVLFGRTSAWQAADRAEMLRLGYPDPRGPAYFCCHIERVRPQPLWFSSLEPADLGPPGHPWGAPFVTTWLDVVLAAQERL